MEQIYVNVTTAVDPKAITREVRNGRDVIVVPSATMPADIVMNGVKYPKAVIEASFASLNRAPAPMGHPKLNGNFLSARDPEAINHFHVGAWNENVRWDGKRILLDKVIDVKVAESTEKGKRLLNAVNKGDPISTSTGLLAEVDAGHGGDSIKTAKSIIFDHDAILLDEDPAASPEQGVGMLVNGKQLEVVNYNLESAFKEIDWAGQEMVRSIQRAADATLWAKVRDKVMAIIKEAVGVSEEPAAGETMNSKDDDMSAEDIKKLQDDLAAQQLMVNEMVKAEDLAAINTALAVLTNQVEGLIAAASAGAEAALAADQAAVVEAGLMNEEEVKKEDPIVVNRLAKRARELSAKPAAPLLRAHALQPDPKGAPKVEDHFV
jgi:hypothetical protein